MILDDIRVVRYYSNLSKRFGNWVFIQDLRSGKSSQGNKGRVNLIRYFESIFGSLGQRWTYQRTDTHTYIIKIDTQEDLLVFLLKFKRVNT